MWTATSRLIGTQIQTWLACTSPHIPGFLFSNSDTLVLHFPILNLFQLPWYNTITSRSKSWTVSGHHQVLLTPLGNLSLFLPCCPIMFLLRLFYFLLKPFQGYQEVLVVNNSCFHLLCLPIPYLHIVIIFSTTSPILRSLLSTPSTSQLVPSYTMSF